VNAAEQVAEEVREKAHLATAASDLARVLHLLHADAVARGVVRPQSHTTMTADASTISRSAGLSGAKMLQESSGDESSWY
jgi:hypothetical protein